MARVILSEYAAKRLFSKDDSCPGISVDKNTDLKSIKLKKGKYVVKVDDGTKKRKQIRFNQN